MSEGERADDPPRARERLLWPPPPPWHEGKLEYDPVADYDSLDRKQLKKIGFIEVLRQNPYLLRMFSGRVPDSMVAIEDEDAVVPCACRRAVVDVPFNVATPCPATCGRWFFWDHKQVRVGYEQADTRTPEEARAHDPAPDE